MASTGILIRRNTALTLKKLRPLAIMMTLAIALLLIADSVVAAGIAKYSQSVTDDSALNMVQVSSVTPGASKPITGASLTDFKSIPHVAGVYGWMQVDLTIEDEKKWPTKDNPGPIWGTPYIPEVSPKVVEGTVPENGPGSTDIILPKSSAAGDFSTLLGQTVSFQYTTMTAPGRGAPSSILLHVVGLYDNSTPGSDGVQASYISYDLLLKIAASRQFGKPDMSNSKALSFDAAYIKPDRPDALTSIQTEVSNRGYGVFSIANQIDSLPGLFKLLSLLTWVIGVFLVLFCVGVGVSVGGSWVQQRVREVGILKAIGWSGGAIARAFCLELAIVGFIVGLAGVIFGVVASLVVTTIVSGLNLQFLLVSAWAIPNPLWILAGVLIVPICLCLGALRSAIRLAKIDADSALRDL
ncbi:ABC transporter permease [Psychromicrobium sp. YIM B11713]|uniref:ABC transporter permease n=1 Tax=Psychromicrobium sp. YIM B11713 TaxID=3145233 RepID=UPI00374EB9A6